MLSHLTWGVWLRTCQKTLFYSMRIYFRVYLSSSDFEYRNISLSISDSAFVHPALFYHYSSTFNFILLLLWTFFDAPQNLLKEKKKSDCSRTQPLRHHHQKCYYNIDRKHCCSLDRRQLLTLQRHNNVT